MRAKNKIKLLIIFLLILAGFLAYYVVGKQGVVASDFRIGHIYKNGVKLESISFSRGMINQMEINPNVSLWIPGGMGWYEAGVIQNLLKQEKKQSLAGDIMLMNFGFDAQLILWNENSTLYDFWPMVKKWGLVNTMKYLVLKEQIMTKSDRYAGVIMEDVDSLNNSLPRDFADAKILESNTKISVYNLGNSSGLANFMSRILVRLGLNVVAVSNYDQNNDFQKCMFKKSEKVDVYVENTLKKILAVCSWQMDNYLLENEIELYVNDDYAKMIKYDNYVGTF